MRTRWILTFSIFLTAIAGVCSSPALAQEDEEGGPNISLVPGSGLRITSEDGRHGIGLSALAQFWATGYESDAGGAGAPRDGLDASMRRIWLTLSGHYFSEHNRFVVTAGTLRATQFRGEPFGIIDAFLEFNQLRDLKVRVGYHLSPFVGEWEQGAANLVLPERSGPARNWHLRRRLGLTLYSNNLFGVDRISYRAGFFLSPQRDRDQLVSVTAVGRMNFTLVGSPVLSQQGDLLRSPSPRLVLGGAYSFLQNEELPNFSTNVHQATADLHFRWHGVALEGSFFWRRYEDDREDTFKDFAGVATLSWMIPRVDLMVVGRFSATSTQSSGGRALTRVGTAGLGYFFNSEHAFKLQLSISHSRTEDLEPAIQGILALQARL